MPDVADQLRSFNRKIHNVKGAVDKANFGELILLCAVGGHNVNIVVTKANGAQGTVSCTLPSTKKAKPPGRSQRWMDAASNAVSALDELYEIQQEYQEWLDNLPENLQQSTLGEKLNEVCNLDIDSAQATVNEAEGIDLPLGFGRD